MKRREFLAASSALAIAPLLGVSGCTTRNGAILGEQQQRHHLRYGFTLENASDRALVNSTLWCYAPVRNTGSQRLTKLAISIPAQEETDAYGNTLIQVVLPYMAPYSALLVNIEAELELLDTPAMMALERHEEFMSAEEFIESENPSLVALAGQLKADSPLKTAKAIYEWVKSEVHYAGFIADDLGALRAFQERRGDCTEYAYLVCALARANGIPARAVGGYVVKQNTILRAEDYHNWAELYIDHKWQLIDAQKQKFMPAVNSYVAFEVVSARNANNMKGAHRYRGDGGIRISMN